MPESDPISDEDLAGWREPGGEYEAVYAIIARLDAAEAKVERLRLEVVLIRKAADRAAESRVALFDESEPWLSANDLADLFAHIDGDSADIAALDAGEADR